MMNLIWDTETTRLTLHPRASLDKQPRMIEFGAVLMNGKGAIEEEINLLVNPEEKLDPQITEITGLTDAQLATEPNFIKLAPSIRRAFAAADRMIAHNLPFDTQVLAMDLTRAGITDWPWPRLRICTVQTYREEWGKNPKLIELYEVIMGKKLAQTHRALDDVHALAEIVQKAKLYK